MERMVLTMRNPTAVTPKISRNQHLLWILTERGGGIAPTLWERRTVLSLCLPCPDRAILSLGRTQCLWSGCGSFIPTRASNITLRFDCAGDEDLEHSWRIKNLKGLKGLHIKGVTPYPASYIEGKWAAFNLRRSPRSVTDETVSAQLPTPFEIIGFGWPHKWDILKTRLEHWNGEDTAWANLKGMSYNPTHLPGKWRDSNINEGQSWASHDVGPTSPKPSSPTKRSSSRILRGYCGAIEFVTLAHFRLWPKAWVEENYSRGRIMKSPKKA